MPDTKKKPPRKPSPATAAAAVAGSPALAGPAPTAPEPMMGGGMGVPPPMPGQGIDPYAALAGMISQTPPMGAPGMGGPPPLGGPDMGMPPIGMGPPGGGPPMDLIANALNSGGSPQSFPPNVGDNALEPQANEQEHLSLQEILTLLSLIQGGIPSSGLAPPARPGSAASGVLPLGLGG